MRKLTVIGIGAGNPEHMTIQGINALNAADLVLIPKKGDVKEDLADLRREICTRYLTNAETKIVEFDLPVRNAQDPSYTNGVADWHARIAQRYAALLAEHAGDEARIVFLVWGDPSLYDSTLRIIDRLKEQPDLAFELEVIPGITSIQALTASHAIPINTVGGAIHITTGRRLSKEGFPDNADSVLVMLDGDCAFRNLPGEAYDIYWGAYLGTEEEISIAGELSDVAGRIEKTRADARQRKGWIMDTYLLRRR